MYGSSFDQTMLQLRMLDLNDGIEPDAVSSLLEFEVFRGLGSRVLGGSGDLVTIYSWGCNPTYNWG